MNLAALLSMAAPEWRWRGFGPPNEDDCAHGYAAGGITIVVDRCESPHGAADWHVCLCDEAGDLEPSAYGLHSSIQVADWLQGVKGLRPIGDEPGAPGADNG